MAGITRVAVETAGWVAVAGVLLGLLAWPLEPHWVHLYGAWISRLVLVALIPACGLVCSLFLALFFHCDPQVLTHSTDSLAADNAAIVLPSAAALVLHAIVLVEGIAGRTPGAPALAFTAGLFIGGLGFVFGNLEPTYVVGIRTGWTLHSPYAWERTHWWASKLYIVSGVALALLSFFLSASGFWSIFAIVALLLLPGLISIVISYFVRDDEYTYIVG